MLFNSPTHLARYSTRPLHFLNSPNTTALLLEQLCLNSLVHRTILHANLRPIESIQLLRLEQIEVNRVRIRNQETTKRHRHSNPRVTCINDRTQHGREHGTARHGGNEERRAALCVAAEPAQTEREDGGEDAGFEEEDHAQHGDGGVAGGGDAGCDEDDAAGQEPQQDEARLDPLHHQTGDEAADGEQGLGDGEQVGALRGAQAGLDLRDVVDEEARDGDLGADVAELGGDAPEEGVLAAEGLVDVAGGGLCLFGLGRDVCVCDLGDAWGKLDGRLRWGMSGLTERRRIRPPGRRRSKRCRDTPTVRSAGCCRPRS